MNQVDIYINNQRLDLFQDEEISINLSVQNIQDLSKVFTDFTQSFTVPASTTNNQILSHYYRTDLSGGFDGRVRQTARIEINSLTFRTGVVQMENVLVKGTSPYSYSLTFYGELVNLTDLFGEDYLYDLDLSAYDHAYDGATIQQGFDSDALLSGDVFYPLMSPVRNWVYNIGNSSDPRHEDDIQFVTGHTGHHHGVHYYELKPAIKVVKILEAIETKYGINFTGDFMSDTQFNKLYLWAHRYEGYLYDSSTAIEWQLINFNRTTGGGTEFNLSTETWTVVDTDTYELRITLQNVGANYEIGLFQNGTQIGVAQEDAHPASSVLITFEGYGFDSGDEVQIKIRPRSAVTFNYQVTDYTAYDASTTTQRFEVDQTIFATYSFQIAMSPLMPEIKVSDFLTGIIKQHNLVVTPNSTTEFNLQTLNDWYADGVDKDFQEYLDITETSVNRPELYRRIAYSYQETEQILGFEYQRTNTTGFGDLRADFTFDGEELQVELPFECPLFERLTDIDNGTLTNILVYKSQTREFDTDFENRFQTYVGAPILIYGEFSVDIRLNPISFVDEANMETQVNSVWYANVSSTSIGTGLAYSLCWGADTDPFYLTPVGKSLYQTYWEDYIVDLYNTKRRLVQVEAQLPIGKVMTFDLKNKIIWNNQKWIVNSANINMTTGKTRLELLNDV
jgi:hypothetical protein